MDDFNDNVTQYTGKAQVEPTFSVNNRLILEAYKTDRALRATNTGGFSLIQQKVTVKGLKLLADAQVVVGDSLLSISKGSIAYIREEYLHTQPWASKVLESEGIEGPFIIVDLSHVEFVQPT